ncbi:RibD family protein [Halomonas sp. NO4]|uniref:RibD family protein n=1 Tax=Halomonas sp. NO4 TaxID=2484813 RepID=UPI0013D56197|nr:RibD family protein [Halomonas sp. NO4]
MRDPAPELDLTAAWEWLQRATHGESLDEAVLRLTAVGDWQAAVPVSTAAGALLDSLAPVAAHRGRLAIAQLGQSLDGRIATESGHSHYVNGRESRVHLHRLRALVDAVVVGAGTAAADDPRLTVRHVSGRHPVRVILDPRGRVPAELQLLSDPAAPTLHLIGEGVTRPDAPAAHVTRLTLPLQDGGFAPAGVLDLLAERGLARVLVEGGGDTVSRFLEAGVLDRLHLLVAPLLIGSGRPGLTLAPIVTLAEAPRPATRALPCGDDTLFDLALRQPSTAAP